MMQKHISIIIPTYNEVESIIPLIYEIEKLLKSFDFEIIVVDDNSPDGTYDELIRKFGKDEKVKILLRKTERGLGTAILHGVKNANNSIIISMDADFNHPPQAIPKLIKELDYADLVVASRFLKGGGMDDKKRYYFTNIYNKFLKHVLGFPTTDNMSGFYAIKKEKLLTLPLRRIYKGYGEYHLYLVYLASKKGLKISEYPVYYEKRKFGKSKSNLLKMLFIYTKSALNIRLLNK